MKYDNSGLDRYRKTITVKKNEKENKTYTGKTLENLAKGNYASRKEIPYVKPTVSKSTTTKQITENTVPKNAQTVSNASRPSTRYQQNVNTEPKKTTRDTRFDNDFNEFHKYRIGDKIGVMDYDKANDREVEHWRNLKTQIMAKNKWSEKEFNDRWDAYYKERAQKEADKEVKDAISFAEKHPVMGTLLQQVYTPQAMVEGAGSMLSAFAPNEYKAQAADDPRFTGTRVKEGIKQTVKDKNIKTGVGKGAYDIGTSLADMALSAAIPVLGTAALGTQTAGRTNMNALERGVDPTKAAITGAGAGVISGIMNKVGFDKAAGAEAKTALGKVIKGAGVEGAENVAEDSANLLLDTLLNTDKSQLATLHDYYVSQGMTDDQATKKATLDTLGDLAISGLSGAAFGGAMNGVRNLPELVGDVRALIPELNNKGGVDAPALIEEARKAMKAPAKVEGAKGNKLVFSPVEGEIRDRIQAEFDANTQQISANEEQINALKALEKTSKGKNKKQYEKQRTALEKENKVLTDQQPELKNLLDGYESTYKGELSKEDRATIFGERNGGAYNMINLARKFAGETPEAVELSKEAKSLLSKYVESGNKDDYYAYVTKLSELSDLADAKRADYVTKGGNRYTYEDIFNRPVEDYLGRPRQETLYDRVEDGTIPRVVEDIHNRFDNAPVEVETKASDDAYNQAKANVENGNTGDGQLTPEEVAVLQDVVDGKYDIPETGNEVPNTNIHNKDRSLPNTIKIPEYTMGEDVYFNGSDADIAQAEAQDQAIVDTFKNIIADPEFNALSFKNGSKEVFVSPATNGNGLRMSYTIDGVPTGHHDYSLDQLDDLARNLRNEAGNGGEDIKVQRKSDIAKRPTKEPEIPNKPPVDTTRLTMNESADNTSRSSFFPPEEPPVNSEPPRSDKTGISKVGTNTMVNSKVYTKKQIESNPVISELNKYAKANNDLTFNKAKENIYNEGATLLDEYTNGKRSINSDLDVDQAMILLTDMAQKIKAGDKGLEAQRNLLFSRLREAGTLYGQTIQAFKKWNNTPEGAIINGEKILKEPVERWKSNNKKKKEFNNKIAKALEQMGVDNSMRNRTKAEKTHEQIKEGVKNVIEKEFGSVEQYFNDNDLEFLTTLAEEKQVPVWQITDEIEHKLATGEWYTLDESTQPKYPVNQRLKSALDSLVAQEPAVKEPPTLDEIKNEVRTTLDSEMARTGEFTDDDVNYLSTLIYNGATKEELAEALNTKMATGKFGISDQTQQDVYDLFAYADRFDPNSKQAYELKSAAYKLLAEETVSENASPLEKFESWRYLAMLGNPKTMMRNFIGNKMFGAVTGVSNNLSAALEAGTDRLSKALGGEGIQRTKTFLNPVDDRALIKAAGEDGEAHRYTELNGTKYEKGTKDAIKQQKSAFNSKLLRLYEAATDRGISDYSAVKKKYSTSLAGYMKANGLDESAFDADDRYRALKDKSRTQLLTDAEKAEMNNLKSTVDTLEKARDYAVKQAEYATFHEDNDFAKWLTKTSNSAPGPLRMVLEGLVPFKKTPANILRSGVEYSPLGAVKSIAETGKLIYENTGKRKGNLDDTYIKKSKLTGKEKEISKSLMADVLDSWSKTLTGTGLVGLGYYLKNKGILNSSNKDEKWQDDLEGIQNYSITINGKTYTLDWAAPAVMPLLMGAEMSKIKDRNGLLDQKWYENLSEAIGTANAILDPIFETSMMQGVKNTLEQAASDIKYNEDNAIGGIVGSMALNTGLGYLTQALPTLSGQVARTVDNTRRTTDTTSDGALGVLEKQGRKIINKVPGLSMLNQPYYDSYGRTQNNGPFNNPLGNMAYQMLSPAYVRDINTTAADTAARNAYYGEGEDGKPVMDAKVFPSWKSKVTVGGEKFTPEEMASYRKTSGEAQYAIRDALANEEWFKNLDATKQTEFLKKVNTLVDKIGKDSVDKLDSSSKEFEAYQAGGVEGLLNKWRSDEYSSKAKEETGLSGSTNAIKEINAAYAEGDTKKAEELTEKYTKYNKERQRINEKYGVNIKMSDFTKREDANPGSNEEWAKEHATATNTTTNTSTNNKVPEVKNTNVDTTGYEKQIERAGKQNKKFTNDLPKLKELNYGKSEMYTYAYAINQDSSLTPQKFDTQFKSMDADKSGSLKQDELINYFNKNNTSQQQAKYLWKTYGENKGSGWKTQPVLKDGTWKKQK